MVSSLERVLAESRERIIPQPSERYARISAARCFDGKIVRNTETN